MTVTPGTVTLVLTTSGSWSLDGDLQLSVDAISPYGPVVGTISTSGSAGGTAVVSSGTIAFTLASLSGTATFTGTVGGLPVTQSFALDELGDVSALYGLTGSVPYSCPSAGTLTLTFPSFVHTF